MINKITSNAQSTNVKPTVLNNTVGTFAAKKKGANVGKISGSGNKPNTPKISKHATSEPADMIRPVEEYVHPDLLLSDQFSN